MFTDKNSDDYNIQTAIECLKKGNLIAFPTETVYGLGADASNPMAVKKVFEAKNRPLSHPLIVHIGQSSDLPLWALEIPQNAWKLANTFWPGPLTLILKKKNHVLPIVTGGQDTVGLRVPNHPLTLKLLRLFQGGLVGPSANPYGRISPTEAKHVKEHLQDKICFLLDGGISEIGIESTIIGFQKETPILLRKGMISSEEIEECLSLKPIQPNTLEKNTPKVPGQETVHYAPQNPLYVLEKHELNQIKDLFHKEKRPYTLISFSNSDKEEYCFQMLKASLNPKQYAKDLYCFLHQLDAFNQPILIEKPPLSAEWAAIQDRLGRASQNKTINLSVQQHFDDQKKVLETIDEE